MHKHELVVLKHVKMQAFQITSELFEHPNNLLLKCTCHAF